MKIKLLQAVIALAGAGVLAFMLWEPHLEGRNAHATPFEIYFKDPFLAFAYLASLPFFTALYQAFKALGDAGAGAPPQAALKPLRIIKYCGLALIGFAALGEVFIFIGESDDRAGGVFMGALVILVSGAMAASAAMFEKNLRKKL